MILLCRAAKGATLDAATAEALALSKRLQVGVEFTFAGKPIRVSPTDTAQKAAARASATLQITRGGLGRGA